jgi:hypothetical protein
MANLERRFTEYRRQIGVAGEDGGPIAIEVTADSLLRQLRELALAGAGETNGDRPALPRSTNGSGSANDESPTD